MAFASPTTVYSVAAAPKPEYVSYSKGVQTAAVVSVSTGRSGSDSEGDSPTRTRRMLSRRERETDDDVRRALEAEIRAELEALHIRDKEDAEKARDKEHVALQLSIDERDTLTASDDFRSFVERSTKVIERAMEDEYDVLADYTVDHENESDDDDGPANKSRRIRQIHQFKTDSMTKTRMISDLDFAYKRPELLLASYTKASNSSDSSPGLALVWNAHMTSRPEFTFTATSDILCAQFSPYHPHLILGGTYSGQVCIWDMRARSNDGRPAQRTPLAGEQGGHAHPIYSLSVVGTQNANEIISVSTDGTSCAWSFDMLSRPRDSMDLIGSAGKQLGGPMAPTCISFSRSDQTCYLAGNEDGSIVNIQRYERAGARAGVDPRVAYTGHAAPVTSLQFHPSRGKVDLADLVLSGGLDWTLKLWRARPQGKTVATPTGDVLLAEKPLLEMHRDDAVYDVKWSPVRAGVFACVDGAGLLDVFDLGRNAEAPVASIPPAHYADDLLSRKSLNKLAWEKTEGRKIAVGGVDGVVSVFEVGTGLGGSAGLEDEDEWMGIKRLVSRLDRY